MRLGTTAYKRTNGSCSKEFPWPPSRQILVLLTKAVSTIPSVAYTRYNPRQYQQKKEILKSISYKTPLAGRYLLENARDFRHVSF